MRVALDTNILAYAEGVNGQARKDAALRILQEFREHEVMLPVQALGELFVVLTRKAKRDANSHPSPQLLGFRDPRRGSAGRLPLPAFRRHAGWLYLARGHGAKPL